MSDRPGFDRIIGQQLAKRVLVKAVAENAPTHAYLFLGLQGTGKATTAIEFAKALNCEDQKRGNACGECAICRAIEHGNFPDIRVWSPRRRDTPIELMQEMRNQAKFKPVRGKWNVNIVEQADTLNEHSANCILKLLEEPPDYLINILLYRNAAAILPTIRSRCQMVRFTQVATDELSTRLREDFAVQKDESEFLATYSQGRPGAAIELVGNDEFFGRRDEIVKAAGLASSGNPWLALRLAEALRSTDAGEDEPADEGDRGSESADGIPGNGDSQRSTSADPEASMFRDRGVPKQRGDTGGAKQRKTKRQAALESLDVLLVWYRDLLAAKVQGEGAAVVNCDRVEEITAQCNRYPDAGRLAAAVDAIVQARRGIAGNANAQIVTESLMMRLAV